MTPFKVLVGVVWDLFKHGGKHMFVPIARHGLALTNLINYPCLSYLSSVLFCCTKISPNFETDNRRRVLKLHNICCDIHGRFAIVCFNDGFSSKSKSYKMKTNRYPMSPDGSSRGRWRLKRPEVWPTREGVVNPFGYKSWWRHWNAIPSKILYILLSDYLYSQVL